MTLVLGALSIGTTAEFESLVKEVPIPDVLSGAQNILGNGRHVATTFIGLREKLETLQTVDFLHAPPHVTRSLLRAVADQGANHEQDEDYQAWNPSTVDEWCAMGLPASHAMSLEDLIASGAPLPLIRGCLENGAKPNGTMHEFYP